MVFLETALESKFNPLLILGRTGSLGLSSFVNKFNADAELLDDLVSHLRYQVIAFSNVILDRMTIGQPQHTKYLLRNCLRCFLC
jgi:hypothetical protein